MDRPKALYTDGGVCGKNPSKMGGAWAWVQVADDRADKPLAAWADWVTPADVGLPTVTNNLTELLGMLHGLERLPVGWAGPVYTDSQVTLCRADRPRQAGFAGIPAPFQARLVEARRRLGHVTFHLLGGHPEKNDPAGTWKRTGVRLSDGKPVSKWNVWADKMCGERTAALARYLAAGAIRPAAS